MTNGARTAGKMPMARKIERCSAAQSDLMIATLLKLLQDLATFGEIDAAGPHVHALMGIAYACAPRGRKAPGLSPSRPPARS